MDRICRIAGFLLLIGLPLAALAGLREKADEALARKEAFVAGGDGWRFLPAELRFASKLGSPEIVWETESAVAVVVDFAAQLKAAGISLVVVPVPPKVMLNGKAFDLSDEELAKMREGWEKILGELSSRQVTVVDLAGDFTTVVDGAFCHRDSHWSGPGIARAAEKLLPFLPGAKPASAADWTETLIKGDLGGEPESVKLRFRHWPGDDGAAKGSPVLLLGDSHVLVFHLGGDMLAAGAGLPEELGAVLGSRPEVLGVRGSGATSSRLQLARRVRTEPEWFASKKTVIWVFAGREFTEADMWKKIPVFPRKANP